jgi:hypothetical protein
LHQPNDIHPGKAAEEVRNLRRPQDAISGRELPKGRGVCRTVQADSGL